MALVSTDGIRSMIAAPIPLQCPNCRESREAEVLLLSQGDDLACPACEKDLERTPSGAPILLPGGTRGAQYYEDAGTLDEYLAFHYSAEDPLERILPGAPPVEDRFPRAIRNTWPRRAGGRALDVGTACGRMTFELARDHDLAVGVDTSIRLVDAAVQIRGGETISYMARIEGDLVEERSAGLPEEITNETNAWFAVADAHLLPFPPESFDTVLALNLIDRVREPIRVLRELVRIVAPSGRLIVASPYTWLEEFTPRSNWLGGISGFRGAHRIREILGLELEHEESLPFFIPHHERLGQLGRSHVQTFRRSV